MRLKINKRVLAREVLIFFGCFILLGICLLYPLFVNTYYNHRINALNDKAAKAKQDLSKLPTVYVWNIYNQVTPYFIKENKSSFQKVDNNNQAWSDDDIPVVDDHYNIISLPFISYKEFETKLQSEEYRGMIGKLINKDINMEEILRGLGYSDISYRETKEINEKIATLESNTQKYELKLYSWFDFRDYMLDCVLFIFIIVYVLRFIIASIMWAIREVRKDSSHTKVTANE